MCGKKNYKKYTILRIIFHFNFKGNILFLFQLLSHEQNFSIQKSLLFLFYLLRHFLSHLSRTRPTKLTKEEVIKWEKKKIDSM